MTQRADLPKPKYGAPCNGCGLCCKLEICDIGVEALEAMDDWSTVAPCPFLVELDGAHRCKIILLEARNLKSLPSAEPLIAKSLMVGWGCTMPDEESERAA